jgi:hypothetical protein
MSIGDRRLDDSQLPRLNRRPICYYLVRGKMEEKTLRQWIVGVYQKELDAFTNW